MSTFDAMGWYAVAVTARHSPEADPLALDELDRALLAEQLHEMADMLTETDTFTPRSR